MRLLWKYIRNYFLVYHLTSHFLLYLQNYKEFEAEILDLQLEKYGLSFDIKKYNISGWALGDENVIGIRSFKLYCPIRFRWSLEVSAVWRESCTLKVGALSVFIVSIIFHPFHSGWLWPNQDQSHQLLHESCQHGSPRESRRAEQT